MDSWRCCLFFILEFTEIILYFRYKTNNMRCRLIQRKHKHTNKQTNCVTFSKLLNSSCKFKVQNTQTFL